MKRNQFVTDLHIKLTDTHQYLNASSCHLFHSKKSLPYSQALKLKKGFVQKITFAINSVTIWRYRLENGDAVTSWLGYY